MSYTYPPVAPTLSGDVVTINRFLQSPTMLARRLRELAEQRYISDVLLTGRYNVIGGAIQYETGESIFVGEDPRPVAPGSEYPVVNPTTGTASLAKTVKYGEDAFVTDESIKRQNIDPVNRALVKLVNQNVKYVDSISLSAIASAVTATAAAGTSWVTSPADGIFLDVALAKANIIALNQGYDPDTVVLDDISFARVMSAFVKSGFLPRESANTPLLTGSFPIVNGMRWLASPNVPTAGTAIVLDSTQLGGMADEDLGGPGYVKVNGVGVEAKTMRGEENDRYRIRCRRVTVPIVVEPAAARKITGIAA